MLDNLKNSTFYSLNEVASDRNLTMIQGDCHREQLLDELVPKVDAVFHLAAILGVKTCVEKPLQVIEGNINGTMILLKKAYQYGKKLIFASTSEIYGKNEQIPFKENSDRILGATSVARWCYSSTKALEEHLCLAYGMQGLPVTILRYFNAFGPRANASAYGGVIPIFIKAALQAKPLQVFGDGKQSRCFTYVSDTVEATKRSLSPRADGQIINIGSRHTITIDELARLIIQLTEARSEIQYVPYEEAYGTGYEDMKEREPHIEKMEQILAYSSQIRLEEGLERTIDWFKKNSADHKRDQSSRKQF